MIQTISDALDFILDWAGHDAPTWPSPSPDLPTGLEAVVVASDLLGPAFYHSDTGDAPLLKVQDTILRPEALSRDADGITLFIQENQGVWRFGFHPDAPNSLLADGDWFWADPRQTPGWSPLKMDCEQALIMTTLSNAFFAFSERFGWRDEPDLDTPPRDCDQLLWHHDSLGPAFPGFWTDTRRSRLYFGGMGQTVIRPT